MALSADTCWCSRFNSTITLRLPWPYKDKKPTICKKKMWIAIMVFNTFLKVNDLPFQVALFTVSL